MTKRKAIIKFCVICVITIIGVAACFVNFRIPFTSGWHFTGFAYAIESKMGIDLKGGVLAVYDTQTKDGNGTPTIEEIDATVKRIENSLTSKGLVEATVVRQGTKIRVEVPGLKDTTEIVQTIGEPSILTFRDEAGNICVEASDIRGVSTYVSETYEHGVKITFTKEGGEKFRTMVQNATSYTQIFLNDEMYSQVTIPEDKSKIGADNTTVITLGKRANGDAASAKDAQLFKLEIESGLYEVKLVNSELSIISPTAGSGALLGGIISLLIGLVFIFIFMFMKYGDLGLLSNLSLVIFMVLFFGALAIVGSVQLTLPGVAGIVLAMAMAVDANIIIFERIKDEYRSGKRMQIAVAGGFNKSFWTIFDANITTIIGAAVLFFLGTGPIKGFAITLLLGVLISMFCSLVITRSFAKLYLYINPNKAKRLRLKGANDYVQELGNEDKTPIKPTTQKPQKRSLNLGDKR